MSNDDNGCGFDDDEWNYDSNTRVGSSHQLKEHCKKHSNALAYFRFL